MQFQGCFVGITMKTLKPSAALQQYHSDVAGLSVTSTRSSKTRSVLLTCHQVLDEAFPIYYKKTIFVFRSSLQCYVYPADLGGNSPEFRSVNGARIEQMAYYRKRPFLKKVERAIVPVGGLNAQLSDIMPNLREILVDIDFFKDTFSVTEAKNMSFDEYWSIHAPSYIKRAGKLQALLEHCPQLAIRGRIILRARQGPSWSEVRRPKVH